MQKVGNEGVITGDESKGFVSETEVVGGMQFDRGYLSPYFITNAEKMIAELEDAVILIHEKKLSSLQPMVPLLESVIQWAKPLLIVAEDLDGEALAKLAGGVAIIRVGGASETEVKERKDRVDDALNATRAAVQEGVVVGGGVALVRTSKKLRGVEGANPDQTAGIAIVRKALQAPLRQIAQNAGVDGSVVAGKIMDSEDASFGFDAQTEEYGDMFKFGIIDPAKVVRTALQDAASVAGLLITTEAMIAEKPEPKGQGGGMPGGMGGMEGMM
jgi:chaperonin GroEL (HSP60 family)